MTCRRLATILIAAGALTGAAPAHADVVLDPSTAFAVGSQPMQTAQAIARAHWGVDPCGGQIALSWTSLAPQINATSTWSNPRSSYDDPQLNGSCQIQFNTDMTFDWQKFCTVVVHEYGHLSGKPHSADANDVMNAFYTTPVAECAATPNPAAPAPVQAPAASAQPAVAKPAAGSVTARAAAKHVVKRGRHHVRKAKKKAGARARIALIRHSA